MKGSEVISLLQYVIMEGARQSKNLEAGVIKTELRSVENNKNKTIELELITDGIPIKSGPVNLETNNAYTTALINLIIKLISIAVYEKHKLPF